ncbi:hypothetical protein DL95DRAFT_40689 [Leptodontidium sp. 2 PMI_412]|nr:hypothetical protein DL95DRAFT_40689 [Leptodontidium sp. 2 PMI_412]
MFRQTVMFVVFFQVMQCPNCWPSPVKASTHLPRHCTNIRGMHVLTTHGVVRKLGLSTQIFLTKEAKSVRLSTNQRTQMHIIIISQCTNSQVKSL